MRIILIFFTLTIFNPLLSQIDSTLIYYHNLEFNKSINYLKLKIKNNNYKNNKIAKEVDLYNLACDYSIVGESKKCMEILNMMLKDGNSLNGFEKDSDFYNVSQTQEWKVLLLKYKVKMHLNFPDTVYLNLSRIAINDQAFNNELTFYSNKSSYKSEKVKSIWKKKDSLNQINLNLVNYYLNNNYNVLSDSVVGSFSKKTFLVIQHADDSTMKRYLPIIKELYLKKETSGSNYALIFDRVSVNSNKGFQYYGTQINSKTNLPYPIKDEKNVDKRRLEFGMEPLKEYLQRFNITYKPKH